MGTQKRKVKADKLARTIQGEISSGHRKLEWGRLVKTKKADKGKQKGGNIQWPVR